MSDQLALKTTLGALWVQEDGPNTQPHYIGCVDLGDITDPQGETELIQCLDEMGGWKNVGQRYSPPGPVTTQLDELLFAQRSYLEKITNLFTLFVLMRDGGRPDIFTNYVRAYVLRNCKVTSINLTNLVHHLDDTESMQQFPITAEGPVIKTGRLYGDRIATTEINALNGLFFRPSPILWNQIAPGDYPGTFGMIACDSAIAPATANMLYSANKGATWAATATDPFVAAADQGIPAMAVTAVFVSKSTVAWIAARFASVGTQGKASYSLDNGATWTSVNIGGAAAGHGALTGNALFAVDQYNIYLASEAGYIYKSTDAGVSWTAVESGLITANGYNAIYFSDVNNGYAVTDTGEVVITRDAGQTWSLVTAPVAASLVSIQKAGDILWALSVANNLYYSLDDGTTWAQRDFAEDGVGVGDDLKFYNSLIGYLAYDTAAPLGKVRRTLDGGFTWELLPVVANLGLNHIQIIDPNTLWLVGEADAGPLGVILRYTFP